MNLFLKAFSSYWKWRKKLNYKIISLERSTSYKPVAVYEFTFTPIFTAEVSVPQISLFRRVKHYQKKVWRIENGNFVGPHGIVLTNKGEIVLESAYGR